jgi:hypothetical protein
MIPDEIRTLITSARAVGFTGSRRMEHPSLYEAVEQVASVLSPLYQAALVGDCTGVDRIVARSVPTVRIVRAAGTRPSHLVQRSARLVDELREHPGALIVGFPWQSAPDGLAPSSQSGRCFNGYRSGTWSTPAYAVGHGLAAAVWLPEQFARPAAWARCEHVGEWLIVHPPERLTS